MKIVVHLKYIFIKSLELAGDWKDAIVVPIFKKGKRNQAINYRPLSLTSIVCKIYEKIVRQALLDHLRKQINI